METIAGGFSALEAINRQGHVLRYEKLLDFDVVATGTLQSYCIPGRHDRHLPTWHEKIALLRHAVLGVGDHTREKAPVAVVDPADEGPLSGYGVPAGDLGGTAKQGDEDAAHEVVGRVAPDRFLGWRRP